MDNHQKELDVYRVWLTVSSTALTTGDQIGERFGLRANVKPLKTPNGTRPRKSFALHSDLEILENRNIDEHTEWMIEQIKPAKDALKLFLGEEGNSGRMLIWAITTDIAGYVEIPNSFIALTLDLGVELVVKYECEGSDCST